MPIRWRRASLGRTFGWLWAAYAVSAYGTGLGFGAFSVVAITVLNAGSAAVAALSASGLAIGALLAVPLGPWMEFRAKRPVMIAMDVVRFAALASVPLAYGLGVLSFVQLLVVSVVAAAARIAFTAASGAYLKTVVPTGGLLVATSRFESTTWSATIIGPPLGGVAIGLLGPVTTVVLDAMSYLLSALGITAIREPEQPPNPRKTPTRRWGDIVEGWRYILAHHTLRRFFFNVMLVNALIMAAEPLLSVLMLSRLGFPVWQYGLAFIQPGVAGLVIVMVTEFGLIICASIFNAVFAAYRLTSIDDSRQARVLTAWSISTSISIAVVTVVWGLLAQLIGPRAAIALAGVSLLCTPFLLPRRGHHARTGQPDSAVVSVYEC